MHVTDMDLWEEVKKTVTPLGLPSQFFRKRRFIPFGGYTLMTRLDLHGMTAQQAYEVVQSFLRLHLAEGTRKVTIVTGKGRAGQGILKKELPQWLDQKGIREHMTHTEFANPGGEGALTIYFKKEKK